MRRFVTTIALVALFLSSSINASAVSFKANEKSPTKQLQSLHFNVFFYTGDDSLAAQSMNAALKDLSTIEEKIGFRLNGKLDIFLLNDPNIVNPPIKMLHSSNRELTNGSNAIINHRIQVDLHSSFEEQELQIKRGIARNLIHEMLFGGTAQERIKYATLLHLPEWFVEGLVNYCAIDWNEELDEKLRNALLHNHFKNINKLNTEQSALMGHSLWRYIDQKKGDHAIRRTLYSVRFSKKLEEAFHFIFNQSSKELISEWSNYQVQRYLKPANFINPQKPETLELDGQDLQILHYDLSPDATKIALTTYDKGLYKVIIWDRDMGTTETWFSMGQRSNRHHLIPQQALIQWKNEEVLYVIIRRPNRHSIYISSLMEISKNGSDQVDEWQDLAVNSFDYDGSGRLAFLGQQNGQSLIRLFNLKTQQIHVLSSSKEYWSDLTYSFNHQALMFASSNLEHSKKGNWQSDLKVLLIDHPETVTRLTHTEFVNERCPVPISNTVISYLSDQNGISNAYELNLPDFKSRPITNYRLGINGQKGNQNFGYVIEMIHSGTKDYIYVSENGKLTRDEATQPLLTPYRKLKRADLQVQQKKDSVQQASKQVETYFQLDFPEEKDSPKKIKDTEAVATDELGWTDVPFKNKLGIESIVSQINNSNIFSDRFTPFLPPELQMKQRYGVLIGVELSDIQHQNSLLWAVRTFPSFNRWDLRLSYTYHKNNWSNSVDIWRQSHLITSNTRYRRNVGSQINYTLGKRVNNDLSLALQTRYRNEEYLELSTEAVNLTTVSDARRNLGLAFRVQYEHLLHEGYNAYHGIKAYAQAEQQQAIGRSGSFFETKIDLRVGLPISAQVSWMSRLHAASNFGQNRMVYFLGGIENARSNEFKSLTYSANGNTAFFSPVYGMRGHFQNVRNGNSFAYLNTEIRWEMGKTLLRYPNPNQVLQKMSLVAFFDAGSAWYGSSPYSKDNPLNTQVITTPVFDITRYNPQQPMVYGLGTGLRSQLYSYFIKYDAAKGWDNGVWGPFQHVISLGKDF